MSWNTLIKAFYELAYFGVTSLGYQCFRGCTGLIKLNVDKILKVTDTGPFANTTNLTYISSDTEGTAYFPILTNMDFNGGFSGSKIKRLFVPSLISANNPYFNFGTLDLCDIGQKCENIGIPSPTFKILVVRATTVPTLAKSINVQSYIFVHEEKVNDYKGTSGWSTHSAKIYAIGGEEWITQFGSADEYADYDKYGVPHE